VDPLVSWLETGVVDAISAFNGAATFERNALF
jgi:hypothetical protein